MLIHFTSDKTVLSVWANKRNQYQYYQRNSIVTQNGAQSESNGYNSIQFSSVQYSPISSVQYSTNNDDQWRIHWH